MMTDDDPTGSRTTPSSSVPAGASSVSQRKERGAIAAQACDTCRSRKQKCDEQRPKCGTCQKFRLECNYREPQPTKKDKTLIEILDRIKNLEGKIDSLNVRNAFSPTTFDPLHAGLITPATTLALAPPGITSSMPPQQFHMADTPSAGSIGEEHYKYVSSVHQMLAWPVMQGLLESAGVAKVPGLSPASIEREGPAIALGLRDSPHSLPTGSSLDSFGSTALRMHIGPTAPISMAPPALSWETMQRLSKAYFDTLHFLYPILDRQSFNSDILTAVFNDGFNEGMASTIALLVFALGEIAIGGSQGGPMRIYNGRPSGVKGGTRDQPPGLSFFNEARKRMGFNLTECSLENVQIFSLASLYYGTCSQHMEFWRMITSASLACQALIASNANELSSPRGDLIRRAFWNCSIMETCLNLELGLPLTGLEKFEAMVGLPDFSGPLSQDDYIGNQGSHFQEYFASQIVLRRLLVEFHITLKPAANHSIPTPGVVPYSPPQAFGSISHDTIGQLSLQLEQWRGMLPLHLRWQEDSPGAFPIIAPDPYGDAIYSPRAQPMSPHLPTVTQPTAESASTALPGLMFTTDLDAPPTTYPFALDIQVAMLRSRYYYSKYLLHRPYLYKALHFPDAMTHDDAIGVADCLKAGLKWPIAMSPTCTRKRLIPCLFFWCQNLLGILVLLQLSRTVPLLRRIRETLCGERFEIEAGETVGLYIDWLRDLKSVDPAADWCWEVVRGLYGLDE